MSAKDGKELAKKMLESKEVEIKEESWFGSQHEQEAYDAVIAAREAVAQAQNALILATKALEKAQKNLEEDKFVYRTAEGELRVY